MNINATLIGQAVAFFIFVWFCMRYVWPPLIEALNERKQSIADGLAAAERGRHEHELAERRATEIIRDAKEEAANIIALGQKRHNEIVDEASAAAKQEAENIKAAAQSEVEQERNRAREQLRRQVAELALMAAGKILEKEIDAAAHEKILRDVATKI
ncbi:F0F1 ATP synthase subunit B [Ectothiorhodospiraceae bacterium BW-2]|nr:F0F1 ATP synthase subunit B [Ectothiorhodospiraceae bacterium BW-2]